MTKQNDIITIWDEVKIPLAPELKQISINASETALLVLDIQNQNCTLRPRCLDSIPKVQNLIERARKNNVLLIYTITKNASREDIREEVFPLDRENHVASGVDKFFNTNLNDILYEHSIQNLIFTGTAAHGAVLHTATGAAIRNYGIYIPIDCISSAETYSEQYTVWHLANSPGTKNQCIVTRSDIININM